MLNCIDNVILDEEYTLQILRRFIDDETIIKVSSENPNELTKETLRSYLLRLAKTKFNIDIMAYDKVYDYEEANEKEILDKINKNIITLKLYDKFDFDDSRSYFEWR